MTFENVYIVIPAKDEATRIKRVVLRTLREGFRNIIVVNDGSKDKTAEIAQLAGATVLNHIINLGAGAATQTGIEYAVEKGAEVIVTLDGDDQHHPEDITKLVTALKEDELDVVIGSRFLHTDNSIPKHRLIYNKIGNVVTAFLSGLLVTDSQSGFKAFTAKFARKSPLNFNGYEFCTEFIRFIRIHKANYTEVPIQVKYTTESLKKGQSLSNGFKMVLNLFRYFFL